MMGYKCQEGKFYLREENRNRVEQKDYGRIACNLFVIILT